MLAFAVAACASSGQRAPHEYAVGEAQNGLTVKVHVSDTVHVTLNSTAWTISGSSDGAVLEQDGLQLVSRAAAGPCFPGAVAGATSPRYAAINVRREGVDVSGVSC